MVKPAWFAWLTLTILGGGAPACRHPFQHSEAHVDMKTILFARAMRAFSFLAALACLPAIPLAHAQVLSAGQSHTCAIDAGRGVQCWGDNSSGQLGDGSLINHALPARVKRLHSDVVAVAATSDQLSCALRANGEVLCWGGFRSVSVPTSVSGLGVDSGVTEIALGNRHACALRNNGEMLCWGSNEYGQLGTGAVDGSTDVPTQVTGFGPGSGAIAMAAGSEHTCAIKADQSVYCWGGNFGGKLGDGTTINRAVPTLVVTLGAGSGAIGVSAGREHTCAVRNDGAVLCWGANGYGQLGTGIMSSSLVPKLVLGTGSGAGAIKVAKVSGFNYHTCILADDGAAYCWGYNGRGQLGDGTTTDRYVAAPVLTLNAGIEAIAAGGNHSCARKSTGALFCWGYNDSGQLGTGTQTDAVAPMAITLSDSIFVEGFDEE